LTKKDLEKVFKWVIQIYLKRGINDEKDSYHVCFDCFSSYDWL
jgi:hypothetical protein